MNPLNWISTKFRVVCLALVGSLSTMVPMAAMAEGESGTSVTAITAAFGDAASGVGSIAATMLAVVAAGIAVKWLLGFVIS